MFLSKEELRTLTGYQRAHDQIKWLKRQEVPHLVSAGGYPIVSRAGLESILNPKAAPATGTEPNWDALEH